MHSHNLLSFGMAIDRLLASSKAKLIHKYRLSSTTLLSFTLSSFSYLHHLTAILEQNLIMLS